MDIKKPQLGKVEAFAFVFQREFCNTIHRVKLKLHPVEGVAELPLMKASEN